MKSTFDYTIFKYRKDNREVSASHVKLLSKSIEKDNMLRLNPIIVNSDFEVIDGQHRLEAAKALKLEIHYIVDNSITSKSIILLNSAQKKWTNEEYLNYWISHKNNHYIRFRELMDEYSWRIFTVMAVLSTNKNNEGQKFKNGEFIFPESKEDHEFIGFFYELSQILKQKKTKPEWMMNGNRFIATVKKLFRCQLINNELMIEKLKNYPGTIIITDKSQNYAAQFLEIYNWRQKKRLRMVIDGLKYDIV